MDADQWVDRGQTEFRGRFAGEPTCIAVAPGRVNLVGGHTDYNDGYVLPVAIDRHAVVAGRRRTDRTVVVYSETLDETARFDLPTVEPQQDASWVDYVAGVVDTLNPARSVGGMELVITSDVPLGAGLSCQQRSNSPSVPSSESSSTSNWMTVPSPFGVEGRDGVRRG